MAKPALGRGLGALLGGAQVPKAEAPAAQTSASAAAAPSANGNEHVERVALRRIRPCPFQPRKDFSPESLHELAESIREQGIVQPLIVRARDDGYELIAGERRWRAAQMIGLTEVPVIIRAADDTQALELALIENLQRDNLNPLEEAQGYQQLIDQFHLRQEDVATRVGKSRVAVANALRLLRLPADLQGYLRNGQLSVGHAKVLLSLTSAEEQTLAAERVVKEGLNVRQTEALVARLQHRPPRSPGPGTTAQTITERERDVHVAALETRLEERLGTRVSLKYRGGKGSIEIRYYTDADLERVLHLLGINPE